MSTLNKKMFRAYLVNLWEYMPEHLRKDIETTALLNVESEEHNRQEEILKEIIDQFFVETATWGLSLYERDYGLTPNPGDDYTQRRNRIYLRLQRHQTSTKEFMKKLVKRYVSAESVVDIEEYSANYAFKVIVDGGDILYKDDLTEAIDTYKPAHLGHFIEYVYKLLDELEISEADSWIINLAKRTRERYPWRGRYFDTSWTFTQEALFDGAWNFNGIYCFDGIPLGDEDIARPPFCFNGDWAFDGNSRFEYQPSRKILFRTDEPDTLSIAPRSAIKEQYDVALPFNVLEPFGAGWIFGARDGPQETAFIASPNAVLPETLRLEENAIAKTVLRAVLRDIYPLPHIRYFDETWEFPEAKPFDGTWELGGNDPCHFADIRYEPWRHLPVIHFEEQEGNIEGITYTEIPLCFDGAWDFGEARRFGDTLEIPHGTTSEGIPYTGRTFNRAWRFFGLHSMEAFWDEDAQEKLYLAEQREPEWLQVDEKAVVEADFAFGDNLVSQGQEAFDGTWDFLGIPIFGSNTIYFEPLPVFGSAQRFNGAWAFGYCQRRFNDSWDFGGDPVSFNGNWRFHGERFFPGKLMQEATEVRATAHLTDSFTSTHKFREEEFFDNTWRFGEEDGIGEAIGISVVVGLHFDEAWSFDGDVRTIDGNWNFAADDYCFGESSAHKHIFGGAWNFTAGNENIIRFESRWKTFGEYRSTA